MSLLAGKYEAGRRFAVGEVVERGDALAVGLRITEPGWSGPVDVFKVFRFDRPSGRIVEMEDCAGRAEALASIGAG